MQIKKMEAKIFQRYRQRKEEGEGKRQREREGGKKLLTFQYRAIYLHVILNYLQKNKGRVAIWCAD